MIPSFPAFYAVGDSENGHSAPAAVRRTFRINWLANQSRQYRVGD